VLLLALRMAGFVGVTMDFVIKKREMAKLSQHDEFFS